MRTANGPHTENAIPGLADRFLQRRSEGRKIGTVAAASAPQATRLHSRVHSPRLSARHQLMSHLQLQGDGCGDRAYALGVMPSDPSAPCENTGRNGETVQAKLQNDNTPAASGVLAGC